MIMEKVIDLNHVRDESCVGTFMCKEIQKLSNRNLSRLFKIIGNHPLSDIPIKCPISFTWNVREREILFLTYFRSPLLLVPCLSNYSLIRLTLNTGFDTLWLSEGNFKTAGPILANDTLAERGGPGASS